jgi:hypothetical protein
LLGSRIPNLLEFFERKMGSIEIIIDWIEEYSSQASIAAGWEAKQPLQPAKVKR